MRKTLFYNFLQTKAEEEASAQVTPTVVEIRDFDNQPPRVHNPQNPWAMRKRMTVSEMASGVVALSHHEAFEFVFRHWTLQQVTDVVVHEKYFVVNIIDQAPDGEDEGRYKGKFNIGLDGTYSLGFSDVILKKPLNLEDEIGLFWNRGALAFVFQLLRRGR